MGDRIENEHVDIAYDDVSRFFAERSKREGVANKYTYVLYQDDNPAFAQQRDEAEKAKIGPQLGIAPGKRALDLGCGIGRWGEYLLPRGVRYVGMDGDAGMVARANYNLAAYPEKTLFQGFLQEFPARLAAEHEEEPFDLILVNGVFMYLNDDDFTKTLAALLDYAAPGATLYLKESMGISERLTLKQIDSAELKQSYSAIYRSIDEYRAAFSQALEPACVLVNEGPLFDKTRNRAETLDYYFLFNRK